MRLILINSLRIFLCQKNIRLLNSQQEQLLQSPSNIAEGCSRRSEKDYYRFIEIALGSSFELETQLLIAKAVNFGDVNLLVTTLNKIDEEQKMLIAFANKLST